MCQIGDIPDADIKPPENVLFVCKLNPVTQVSNPLLSYYYHQQVHGGIYLFVNYFFKAVASASLIFHDKVYSQCSLSFTFFCSFYVILSYK